ncbi:hypothetical protein EG68_12443, partial [Paragonimus skrjabini miyazakii]
MRLKYNSADEIVLGVDVDVSEYYRENPSRTLNEILWLLSSHINKYNPDCEATIQLDGENTKCANAKIPGVTGTNGEYSDYEPIVLASIQQICATDT